MPDAFDFAIAKLEFDKIRERLLRYAVSDPGREVLRTLPVSTSLPAIRSFLSAKRVYYREQAVVIRGDRNVKWDHVAAVMRTCAEAGIAKVSATYEVLESR